jgi:hypothetical protein
MNRDATDNLVSALNSADLPSWYQEAEKAANVFYVDGTKLLVLLDLRKDMRKGEKVLKHMLKAIDACDTIVGEVERRAGEALKSA